MKKIIALATADWHINDWKESYTYKGDRLSDSIQPMKYLGEIAASLQVPILFSGDLFHKPKSISNEVFEKFIKGYTNMIYQHTDFVAISGNHDQSKKNTYKHTSPSYINSISYVFKNFTCLDNGYKEFKECIVGGIPYYTNNLGFNKTRKKLELSILNSTKLKILLIHRDLPGAKNPQGFEVNESEDMKATDLKRVFRKWDLVLCGHIHKPQKIAKNIYMLGSPGHQNAGDRGIDMGYWEVYNDKSVVFKKLALPEYKYYDPKKPLPDNFHIYMPQEEKVLGDILSKSKFTNKMNKVKIAKNYLKAKGIKNTSKKKALIKALIVK